MQKKPFTLPRRAKNGKAALPADDAAQGAAASASAAVDSELAAALGLAPKAKAKLPVKKLLLAAIGALALAGLVFGGVKLLGGKKSDGVTYREYTVARGDITVGQNETSSVSLNRETVQFPVEATVLEVYVKEGSSVDKGDALLKLDADDIAFNLTSFELEVQTASLELEKAKLEQQSKLLDAQHQLETSTLGGELASVKEANTKESLQLALTTAEKTLADAKAQYETYCLINTTFAADYLQLSNLETTMDELENRLEACKTQQTEAKAYESAASAVTSALSSLRNKIASYLKTTGVISSSGYTVEQALNEACADIAAGKLDICTNALTATMSDLSRDTAAADVVSAWKTYLDALTTYHYYNTSGTLGYTYAELSTYVTTLTAQFEGAQNAYLDFYEYYKTVYGDIEDAEDMADAVTDAETAVEKAKLALSEQEVTNTEKRTTAEQTAASSATAAEVASAAYELTEMELSQAVDTAQEEYDALLRQLDEVKALIASDGVVTAPCDGMIAEVNVEAEDELTVFIDEDTHTIMQYATLLTMTDIADVYVPITISEEDILSVYIGQRASVTMNSFPSRTFDAEVDTITIQSSRSGAATVSYTVNVKFSGVNTLDMYEGMNADVTLLQREASDVLYVNNQAVTNAAGTATVLKKDASGAGVETVVTTGFSDGRYVEILSGLNEGDVVLAQSAVGQG